MEIPTREQIRQHIIDLRRMIDQPCFCKTRKDRAKCKAGRRIMAATIVALGWAAGDNERYDEVVADIRRRCNNPYLKHRVVRFEKRGDENG
jgi:hypothetical protein